jgi:hypothetical protein
MIHEDFGEKKNNALVENGSILFDLYHSSHVLVQLLSNTKKRSKE